MKGGETEKTQKEWEGRVIRTKAAIWVEYLGEDRQKCQRHECAKEEALCWAKACLKDCLLS